MNKAAILLVYDRQCPACNAYCQLVNIRKDIGELQLVDAREDSQVMHQITQQGLDIDQGMVLKVGNQLYYGSDAIHALALMGSRASWFNRFNYWMFRSKRTSAVLYPLLRLLRNLLLKLLRRSKINNLSLEDNEHF